MNLLELLQRTIDKNASDLHLATGLPPAIRVDGDLCYLDYPVITIDDCEKMLFSFLNDQQKKAFAKDYEIGFILPLHHLARFRINLFKQQHGIAAALRRIPQIIPTLNALNLPESLIDIANLRQGLILVTGATGAGKSTTLAAIIDHINQQCAYHILTIEDPIEYIHQSKTCLINQRELQRDTLSFSAALRSALRADPDIILIGELRDQETIRLALTAAETGHLVFATLHTASAAKTIHRIVDVFSGEEKNAIRTLLSEALQAVISQKLVKKIGGGRHAIVEIMRCNAAIRNLIREDKIAQMNSAIQTGKDYGMQTMAQHASELINKNIISRAVFDDF